MTAHAKDLKGGAFVDYWLDLTYIATPRVTASGGTSSVTVGDENRTRYATATYQDDKVISGIMSISKGGIQSAPISWSSSDAAVATVASNGTITHVDSNSTGTATITGNNGYTSRSVIINFTRVVSTTVDTWVSYVSGSLADHLRTQIDSRLSGLTASNTTQKLFSATNVRNTSLWCANVNLSMTSTEATCPGTLISPRHYVTAEHCHPVPGATLTFVTNTGNTVVARTISAIDEYSVGKDVNVGILDSDVPSGVAFAKVLPANTVQVRFPSAYARLDQIFGTNGQFLTSSAGVPCLRINQLKEALAGDTYSMLTNTVSIFGNNPNAANNWSGIIPTISKRLEFYKDLVNGDSGNPGFFIINGEAVLCTAWGFGGGGAGASYAQYIAPINAAMHSLSTQVGAATDYQLSTVDLSGFNSY